MNINDIKASYLKQSKKNYYLFRGYHIQLLNNGYWLTVWLCVVPTFINNYTN